jgi:hypothetical protein
MKLRHLIFLAALIALVASCSSKGSKQEEQNADDEFVGMPEMVVNGQDSIAVKQLVDKFMDLAINKQYDAAAAMICDIEPDDEQPLPIAGSKLDEVIGNLKALPITSYEIKNIIFKENDDNEVRCVVTINNQFQTAWYFKPVRYLGDWSLCLKNSIDGDHSLEEEPSANRGDIE